MNIEEAFKQLRDSEEWLFDELDINNREDRPTAENLRVEYLKLIPERSNEELARYTVVKMVSRMFGGAISTEHQFSGIESALRILFIVFGGDGPDAGMTTLTEDEYNDNSDLTLSGHLIALNKTAIQFEWLERDSVFMESDLWGHFASSAKIDRPEMLVWITAVKRMTESLRDGWYFEDLKTDRSLEINDELQNIFSVYRTIRAFEEVK